MIESGQLKPVIDRAYTLEQAPEATWCLEGGHACGKVVVGLG